MLPQHAEQQHIEPRHRARLICHGAESKTRQLQCYLIAAELPCCNIFVIMLHCLQRGSRNEPMQTGGDVGTPQAVLWATLHH